MQKNAGHGGLAECMRSEEACILIGHVCEIVLAKKLAFSGNCDTMGLTIE